MKTMNHNQLKKYTLLSGAMLAGKSESELSVQSVDIRSRRTRPRQPVIHIKKQSKTRRSASLYFRAMDKLAAIERAIYEKRKELNQYAETGGLSAPGCLRISKELDELLNVFSRMQNQNISSDQ